MNKVLLSFAGFVSAIALFSGTAFADTPDQGQIEGGDIYRVKNLTDSTSFVKNVAADPCETVQFKVRIHNPGPRELKNVKVKATLSSGTATSHASTVTVSASNAYNNETATATAGVTVSKASAISYVGGSTELLDNGGSRIATLGDTVLSSGVMIDTVGVSLNHIRYVQFKAKLNCPEPPVVKIKVCELASKKIITIDEKNFDATKHSRDLTKCAVVPPVKITVCELATKKIVNINESDFDSKKHSKNLADCAAKPPVEDEITVCVIETGKIVNVKESDFDSTKHSKDLSDCAEDEAPAPVLETPAELPETGGLSGAVVAIATILAAGTAYAVQARRKTLG